MKILIWNLYLVNLSLKFIYCKLYLVDFNLKFERQLEAHHNQDPQLYLVNLNSNLKIFSPTLAWPTTLLKTNFWLLFWLLWPQKITRIIIPATTNCNERTQLGKGAEKKCGKSMVFYQTSLGPPPGLVFFAEKKLTPIFFVGKCICNSWNEFYVWSHV